MTVLELLSEDNKTVISAVVNNLNEIVKRFCNTHAKNLICDPDAKEGEESKTGDSYPGLLHSKT